MASIGPLTSFPPKCYLFESETSMTFATMQQLERASLQGTILPVEVDGIAYGPRSFSGGIATVGIWLGALLAFCVLIGPLFWCLKHTVVCCSRASWSPEEWKVNLVRAEFYPSETESERTSDGDTDTDGFYSSSDDESEAGSVPSRTTLEKMDGTNKRLKRKTTKRNNIVRKILRRKSFLLPFRRIPKTTKRLRAHLSKENSETSKIQELTSADIASMVARGMAEF